MKRVHTVGLLVSVFGITCLMLSSIAGAADRVIVVPLGGAVGNAMASDVVKGKTFSSMPAGKGVTGTLEISEGSTFYSNSIGMKFSRIPAGSFVMGSPAGTGDANHRPIWDDENGGSDEIQHVVILSKSFYMQTTEVTQRQWEQVMGTGTNPSYFTACGMDCPVERVSWDDAQNFIDALNTSEGRSNCNMTPNTCYSLPTESQWEYAARGGTLTAFYSGAITNTSCTPLDSNLDNIGWYCGNADFTTHPVAQKEPNTWRLYDMSGNVNEWCEDFYGTYPDGPAPDPTGAAFGSSRVIRGGSWINFSGSLRSADRVNDAPGGRSINLGFRLVLPPDQ